MGSEHRLSSVVTDDKGVICILSSPRKTSENDDVLVVLANFTEFQKSVRIDTKSSAILREHSWTDLAQGKFVKLVGDPVILGPYEILLLTRST